MPLRALLEREGLSEAERAALRSLLDGEAAREASSRNLRAIADIATELSACPDADTVFRRAVELARERLGVERCAIFVPDGNEMRGTYGTDMRRRTTAESGATFPREGRWAEPIPLGPAESPRWERIQSVHAHMDEAGPVIHGEGWVVFTPVQTVGNAPRALFVNDAAISGRAVDPALQDVVAVLCVVIAEVLERQAAEAALREGERRYRAVFDTRAVGIAIASLEGQIVLANEQMWAMWGRAPDGGRCVTVRDLTHPDDLEASLADLARLLSGETESFTIDKRYVRPDGSTVWARTSAALVGGGEAGDGYIALVAEDISERRGAEEALRDSEARYRSLVEDQSACVARFLPDGTLAFANQALAALLGGSPDELAGRELWDVVPGLQAASVLGFIDRHGPERPSIVGEHATIAPDGSPRWIEWTSHALMDASGRVTEFQAVGVDITERRASTGRRERQARLLRAVPDIASELVACADVDAVYRRTVELLRERLGLERCGLFVAGDLAMWGTYGTDMHGRTTDEHAQSFPRNGQWAVAASSAPAGSAAWTVIESELGHWDPDCGHVVDGTGWVVYTPIRSQGGLPIAVLTNDCAISGSAIDPGLQDIVAVVGSVVGSVLQRKAADGALRESEERFRRVVEAAPLGVLLFELSGEGELALTQANATADRLLACSCAELLGLPICEAFPRIAHTELPPALRLVAETGESWTVENVDRSSDGKVSRAVELRAFQTMPGRCAVLVHDVSDQRRAEEEARRAASLLQAALESTADGILVVGDDGRWTASNGKFLAMWGITPEADETLRDDAAVLASVLDRVADPEGFVARVGELYADREATGFDTILLRDGRRFERYSQPQRLGDRIVGRVWSFRDVTERVRAEEARLELERRVLHAQKLESLGVLAGGIAHDFNNLLTVVLGHADLAGESLAPDAPSRANLSAIREATGRARGLALQVLAYSGRGQFRIEPLDLGSLTVDMLHLLRASVPKGTRLGFAMAEGLPAIRGDRTQLEQVVMNLVTNAAESLGSGGGAVRVSTGTAYCSREELDGMARAPGRELDDPLPEGEYVYLEVSDSGCGMDGETLSRVFDPFFTTKFAGRGLGMSATLGIVRGHRGAIDIRTAPGEGSTFRVLFPMTADLPEPPPAPAMGVLSDGCGGGTVLVVDDEDAVREVAVQMVAALGFDALTATNGAEAVAAVEREGESLCLVLLDLTMPVMGGEQALAAIRRLRPGLPVIVCSGYAEPEVTERFLHERPEGFLQKPFTIAEMADRVREARR